MAKIELSKIVFLGDSSGKVTFADQLKKIKELPEDTEENLLIKAQKLQ